MKNIVILCAHPDDETLGLGGTLAIHKNNKDNVHVIIFTTGQFGRDESKKGIENRPIISGNFLNQPASKFYNFNFKKNDFKNSNEVENRGFFIGLHTKKISKIEIEKIIENLLDIDKYL